jgi:hypothetical protein
MNDRSRPLEPEHQRIVDRTVQSLLAAFYVDGVPVFANDVRADREEQAR